MRTLAVLLCLQLAIPIPTLEAQSDEAADSMASVVVRSGVGARVDSLLRRYAEYGFAGAVLVARKGELLLVNGYGLADRRDGKPNTPATLYDFASITKTLTGAAALALEGMGKLSISDPVTRYVGPVAPKKESATLLHLAQHTSGFVVRGTDVGDASRLGFMDKMRRAAAEAVAGREYRYTNAGSSLLAAIVEEVAGMPYEDFVRERLLLPAGIHGGFRWESDWNARRARGYDGRPGEPVAEAVEFPTEWGSRGAGGWIGTVGDVYRWHRALFGNDLLPAAQRAQLLDSTVIESFGWHYEPRGRQGKAVVHKGGDTPGFQSQLTHFPDEDVTIVWANNDTRHRWRTLLNEGIARLVLGDGEVELPPAVVASTPTALAELAGRYADARGNRYELRAADDYLHVASGDSVPLWARYHPAANGAFVALPARGLEPLSLTFSPGDAGEATAVTWSDGRVVRTWRRVRARE
jgi:CubicO group peptidase (beta-lactamase class C family)